MKHKLITTCILLLNLFVVSAAAQQKTISILLTQPPLPTGITFTKGQQITVTASGEMNWYTGGCPVSGECITTPDGYPWSACENDGGFDAPGLACWSLIGQIGPNGTPFQVGSSFSMPAPASGQLYLGVNDNYYPDNTGKWTAVIDLPNAITLVDPVSEPSLLDGNQITEAATAADVEDQEPYLADLSKGRPVLGVASDGVAQVVVRIMAGSVGEQFTLDLGNQCVGLTASACVDEYGLLFDPTNPDSSGTAQTVTSVPTENGAMAFAAFKAPIDFVRTMSDQSASSRTVTVHVTSSLTGIQPALNIIIVRPPVFLIHGIFSSPDVFNSLIPAINDPASPLFYVVALDYSTDIDSEVTSTVPADIRSLAHIRRNVVGVRYNAPFLLEAMAEGIEDFKEEGPFPSQSPIPVAAVQADVVAHSLGGLMARGMVHVGTDYPMTANTQTSFGDDESYGRGYIHKLITLGTPHLGTNFALRLINGDAVPNVPTLGMLFPNLGGNDCTRKNAGVFGDYNFNSVTISGKTYPGATLDLYGDPTQGIVSPTIALLNQPNSFMIPTGLLAASFTSVNGQGSSVDSNGILAKWACGTQTVFDNPLPTWVLGAQQCPTCVVHDGDFLADNYSFADWKNIFKDQSSDPDQASDALVPVTSATFGQDSYWALPGVVHGPGTVGTLEMVGNIPYVDPHIGFTGPQLLDPSSGSAAIILQLLNTSVNNTSSFVSLP